MNQEIRNNYHKTKFNKKVCVFTWYDNGIKEYADITSEINQSYCDKEGFTFYKDNIRRLPDRTPHWERLPLFVELIPKYDYVIWIDADACFRNNSHKLKDIITNNFTEVAKQVELKLPTLKKLELPKLKKLETNE